MYLKINKKRIKAKKGQTILEAAQENKIEIPALCYHPDLNVKASCRLCLVTVKGWALPLTACSTQIVPGMEVITESPEIRKLRKINLELLFSQHKEECQDCILNFNCQLLKLAKDYEVETSRFFDRKTSYEIYQFGPSLIFDSSKCVDCRNCIEVCKKKSVGYLKIKEKDENEEHFCEVVPSAKKECIFCGQCILHCPAGSFEAMGEFEEIEQSLQNKNEFVVFQFAPSIRTSIGEEFGKAPGTIVTEQLTAGIKSLGVNKVFDVSVGADFTATEEARELLEKMKSERTSPLLSSCCPAWVRFVECYEPQFIPYLATARPPHIILGGLIKTYYSKKENIPLEKIKVVSVMPCVAKKYEITRDEFRVNNIKPVDYVLTTRELARLFKNNKIDLKTIKPEKADFPFGVPSGAGVIYGASGGVMESALRAAMSFLRCRSKKIAFKRIRGQQGIKTAKVKIGSQEIKIAVTHGIDNAKKILEQLKENPRAYDCVEVMACPGGCVGGGGQPVPTNSKIRQKRAQGLYRIDNKMKTKTAAQNPIVKKMYKEILNNEETIKKICQVKYSFRNF